MKPLLDLFCGAGGASMGYHQAGFKVVGVDKEPQPNYPFDFIQADAIEFLEGISTRQWSLVHLSPPCQRFSVSTYGSGTRANHPDFITPSREILTRRQIPYVMENVLGAPLIKPIVLCGSEFNLRQKTTIGATWMLKRHRLFESPFPLKRYGVCTCGKYWCGSIYGKMGMPDHSGGSSNKFGLKNGRIVMGMPWVKTYRELAEAIPPVYTKWIGEQIRGWLK